MATTLDEPADRLKRSLNALVSKHEKNPDLFPELLGAKNMIEYVLDRPVLMRNKASRTKFLEQMRDELMQLYDAAFAGATTPATAPPVTSNAEAMIEARLIADFVAKHDGKVVQIADADTWMRLTKAAKVQPASSGTDIIVFGGSQQARPTVFFQKPREDTPLSKVVEFIREARTVQPRTYEAQKLNTALVHTDGTVQPSLQFCDFSVLRNGLPTPEGNPGAIFLADNLPLNLEHVDYLTIFPFDAKAYEIVVDAKNKYDDDIFKYTNDVITRATYQSRTIEPTHPKPALNYLLGIADNKPFEDFVFYNS